MDCVKEEPMDSEYTDEKKPLSGSASVVGSTPASDPAQEGVRQNSLQRIQQRKQKVWKKYL